MAVKGVDQLLQAGLGSGIGNVQLITDARQQFAGIQPRVEDQRDIDILRQLLQQGSAQSGLAGAHLAAQHHEPAAHTDAIQQVRQRLAVLRAQI